MKEKDEAATATAEPVTLEKEAQPVVSVGESLMVRDVDSEAQISKAIALRQRNLLATLQQQEKGLEILERRGQILTKVRQLALSMTSPVDWVLFRTREGAEIAMLCSSGARKIRPIYGISVHSIRPTVENGEFDPIKIDLKNDAYALRAWCDAESAFTAIRAEGIEATIRSDEDFTGRKINPDTQEFEFRGGATDLGDLRSALRTRLEAKATRIVGGFSNVPIYELEEAWHGQTYRNARGKTVQKTVDDCRKGHGYGTSQERTTERAAATSEDADKLAEMKVRLGQELDTRCGGDQDEMKKVLKRITKGPKFPGWDSIKRMGKVWQVENALKALRDDEEYGDAAMGNSSEGGGE